MTTIKHEVSTDEYAKYQAMTKSQLNRTIEDSLSEDIVCGYGYYGAYLEETEDKHYVCIRIGDSCD